MTLKTIKGDLIALAKAGEFDAIFHGCNCFHTMGSGIAKQIKEHFPGAYRADVSGTECGDIRKLGNWTYCCYTGEYHTLYVYNLYTQFKYGTDESHFNCAAFKLILDKLEQRLFENAVIMRLGFPLIGCGLAGGDPIIVKGMLEQFAENVAKYGNTVTLVEYE